MTYETPKSEIVLYQSDLHYNLSLILAVDYRVRSARGTQFRQWATARLSEYLVKGFTMDDERLKSPHSPGVPDYYGFDVMERRNCAKSRCHRCVISG